MVYNDVMRGLHNIFNIRLAMVYLARERGISETDRQYNTTRNTVRKWVRRYEESKLKGLQNQSRAPRYIPHKTSKEIEDKVIELRKTHPVHTDPSDMGA